MGAKIQAFDIFQTPLSSHYPLPLKIQIGFGFSVETKWTPDFHGFQSTRISVQFPLGGCPMICIPAIPRSYTYSVHILPSYNRQFFACLAVR